LWEYFPPILEKYKNINKRKGKESNRKVTYLLVFFDEIEIKMRDLFVMFKNVK